MVGLIPDSEILRCKGPPVLNERERYLLVDAVKWVDEVVKGDRGRWYTHIYTHLDQGDQGCHCSPDRPVHAGAKTVGSGSRADTLGVKGADTPGCEDTGVQLSRPQHCPRLTTQQLSCQVHPVVCCCGVAAPLT